MQIVHSTLDGRFFGGDTVNQPIVSGAHINAPSGPIVPAPPAAILLGIGAALLGALAWARRPHLAMSVSPPWPRRAPEGSGPSLRTRSV